MTATVPSNRGQRWTTIADGQRIRELRRVVTGAQELKRAEKMIGSSLEAAVTLQLGDPADLALFQGLDLAEIAITSAATVAVPDAADAAAPPGFAGVTVVHASGDKCARCWRVLEEVARRPDTHLCDRCTDAVRPA